MYSGTTFRNKSGRVIGTHQKIDRVARRRLRHVLPKAAWFPTTKEILHFEGKNGPDGIKSKSPGVDEPWHFIDPYHKDDDHQLLDGIRDHIHNLTQALRDENQERAAFEAAWLSHAIIDGLTPAHHYPHEEKLEELRGAGLETRTRYRDKIMMPGKSKRELLKNNWHYWGAKGLMTSHLGFELGVATTIASLRFNDIALNKDDIELATKDYIRLYRRYLKEVASLELYDEYIKKGWTRRLARDTKGKLTPLLIQAVMLGWYVAAQEAHRG